MMAISTDSQILACKQELSDFRNQTALQGTENWKIRIREAIARSEDRLQTLHEKDGEPKPTFSFQSALSSVEVPLGYLQNAISEFESSNEREGRNQSWQAVGYLTAAIAALYLAIEEDDDFF